MTPHEDAGGTVVLGQGHATIKPSHLVLMKRLRAGLLDAARSDRDVNGFLSQGVRRAFGKGGAAFE